MRSMMIMIGVLAALVSPAAAQVPNMEATVKAIYTSATWELRTKAGNGCFTEAVAYRLHEIDPAWGHLRKFGGQNQWNGHAVDAILHGPTGYAVDIIGSSESVNARPSWGIDRDANTKKPIARYTDRARYFMVPEQSCAPGGGGGEPPPPPLPPSPAPELKGILEQLERLRGTVDALNAAVTALAAKPDPVINLPPVEIPPFVLPAIRCTGNTKPFGGALVLDCVERKE